MSAPLQIRKYQEKDLSEMVRITNDRSLAMGEPPAITEDRLLRRFEKYIFGLQIDRDLYLARQDNEIVAYMFCMLNGDHSTGYFDTIMDPTASPRGVLPPLQAKAEEHIRQTLGGDKLPPEKPFFIDTFAMAHQIDEEKCALLKELGYFEVRRFYDMFIQLVTDFEPVSLPDGLEFRPFNRKSEGRAYQAAYLESFEDHWGNISIYDYDQFAKHFDNPDFKDSLWFAAWDGDEIAGVLCGETSTAYPNRGVVDLLAVRRPWRRRGLGTALLRQAFYVFQQHGFTEAELNVDSESRTNAHLLYQRAGMDTIREEIVLRKMIWGRPEDIVE